MGRLIEIPEGIFKDTIKNGKVTTNEDAFRNFICQPDIASKALPVYDMEGLANYKLHFIAQEIDFGHGPLDGLFIDKYGIFTILEVKRAADSRTRREVLVQLLDYGSAFNRITWRQLAAELLVYDSSNILEDTEVEPDSVLAQKWFVELYGKNHATEPLIDEFSQKIARNLEKGYIRLIDATEIIDQTLVDLAHYVTHGNQSFSLGLCELSIEELGESNKLYLNPHLKFSSNRFPSEAYDFSPRFRRKGQREWNKETFMADLGDHAGAQAQETAEKIMDWVDSHKPGMYPHWGKGISIGYFYPRVKADPQTRSLFALLSTGKIEMSYVDKPISEETKGELFNRLKQIDPNLSEKILSTWSSMSLEQLADESKLDEFFTIYEWIYDEVQKSCSSME